MATPDVRQTMFSETMDYTGMTMWTPTPGLNIKIANFNSCAYTVSGSVVTLEMCGVFGTLLTDSGNTAELDGLTLAALAGSTYSASLEFINRDDNTTVLTGTMDIDPAVNATKLVLNPPVPFESDTLYTIKVTMVYTQS